MKVRSDIASLNQRNDYANRALLIKVTLEDGSTGWRLYDLEKRPNFHIYRVSGYYQLRSFVTGKVEHLSTKNEALKVGNADAVLRAVRVLRDRLIFEGLNNGVLRIVDAQFKLMHKYLQELGGRYLERTGTDVEKVEFPSKSEHSEEFKAKYPDIRVTYAESEVSISVNRGVRSGKSKETKVHGHPTRVTHQAAAKRRGRTK